jgi:hypothetical protein
MVASGEILLLVKIVSIHGRVSDRLLMILVGDPFSRCDR